MIGESLKVNSSLTHLDLAWNKIGTEAARKLNRCLDTNTSIIEFNLGENAIHSSLLDQINLIISQNAEAKKTREKEIKGISDNDKIVFTGVNGRSNYAEELIRERLGEEIMNVTTAVKKTSAPAKKTAPAKLVVYKTGAPKTAAAEKKENDRIQQQQKGESQFMTTAKECLESKDIELIEKIGNGHFGEVWRGVEKRVETKWQ
eukprot:TRINITY_DN4102_c0_g1_i6.p1 TRINITY_DN4102_c0_g1~~TRINITY_DN4102_c0_g1_i6.p1  ORF type:complete len:203 (-),score=43.63 TRINITY_DN4102_c0_g1_i6:168-776(-)